MARVICDSTGLATRKTGGYWFVRVIGLRAIDGKYHNGFRVLPADNEDYSEEEVLAVFFERLEQGKLMTNFCKNGDRFMLVQDGIGKYSFHRMPKQDIVAENRAKALQAIGESKRTEPTLGEVVADPKSASARALLGCRVETSNSFTFAGLVRAGKLLRLEPQSERPFVVETQTGVEGYSFIRSATAKIVPLRLADPEVRKMLRDRWLLQKNGLGEVRVNTILCVNGSWRVNGLGAQALLSDYTFEDGSPVGEVEQ